MPSSLATVKGWIEKSIPNEKNRRLVQEFVTFMETTDGNVAIHPRFGKLITALRTAVENGEGILDKDATSHDDLFDSFRLSLQFWH
jgi:hypothetical protein